MQVRFRKVNPNAVTPSYAKPGDAGLDFVATGIIKYPAYLEYKTDIAVEIPEGYVGLLFPRSSISDKALTLANSVGVVDSGYRGEVRFRFKVDHDLAGQLGGLEMKATYSVGDKIGQMIILPYPTIEMVEAEQLTSTERGEGGYGSTGN